MGETYNDKIVLRNGDTVIGTFANEDEYLAFLLLQGVDPSLVRDREPATIVRRPLTKEELEANARLEALRLAYISNLLRRERLKRTPYGRLRLALDDVENSGKGAYAATKFLLGTNAMLPLAAISPIGTLMGGVAGMMGDSFGDYISDYLYDNPDRKTFLGFTPRQMTSTGLSLFSGGMAGVDGAMYDMALANRFAPGLYPLPEVKLIVPESTTVRQVAETGTPRTLSTPQASENAWMADRLNPGLRRMLEKHGYTESRPGFFETVRGDSPFPDIDFNANPELLNADASTVMRYINENNVENLTSRMVTPAPVSDSELGEALMNTSEDDLRNLMSRLRSESSSRRTGVVEDPDIDAFLSGDPNPPGWRTVEGNVESTVTDATTPSTITNPATGEVYHYDPRSDTYFMVNRTGRTVAIDDDVVQHIMSGRGVTHDGQVVMQDGSRVPMEEAVSRIAEGWRRRTPSSPAPTTRPTSILEINPELLAAVDRLNAAGYTERMTGWFSGPSHNVNLREGVQHFLTDDNRLLSLDLTNPEHLEQYILSGIRKTLAEDEAATILRNPYVLLYRSEGERFTPETLPGRDRTELVEDYDINHMNHSPGRPILDANGHLVGHEVKGLPYEEVIAQELADTPHGASLGFNGSGSTSTSSTPMIWLKLRQWLSNGSFARAYIPTNGSRYTLNNMGRGYVLNSKGRMVSIPGTEGRAFSGEITHMPQYAGAKNVKVTLGNGSEVEVVLLPNGLYIGHDGLVSEAYNARPLYTERGMIYDPNSHRVIYSVDQPLLTADLYVEHLNSEYINPLLQLAGLEAEGARVVRINPNGTPQIEVPSIAGIKYKQGGTFIDNFRKYRKCKKI